jgi:hypothetical protein
MGETKKEYKHLVDALDHAIKMRDMNPMSSEISSVGTLVRQNMKRVQDRLDQIDAVLVKSKEESAASAIKLNAMVIAKSKGYDENEYTKLKAMLEELHELDTQVEAAKQRFGI